ncbi:MAG: endonuclease V [Elusimicrobiota bacterium]|nr:endonuclease V [Elusimicrobiota bacterium]
MRNKVVLKSSFSAISEIGFIAGCDVGYDEKRKRAYGSVVLLTFPELKLVEKKGAMGVSERIFPYLPGLLTFREGPVLIAALRKLERSPDIIIFDGQGIAHPVRFGLATHMGLLLGLSTIGCAKSVLYGHYEEPVNLKGAYTFLKDEGGELMGAALRTKNNVKPVFVSQGHRIDLDQALDVILTCCKRGKIPEPLRLAHLETVQALRGKP